jgi:hypothetical protein
MAIMIDAVRAAQSPSAQKRPARRITSPDGGSSIPVASGEAFSSSDRLFFSSSG